MGGGARKVRIWAGDRSYPVALLFDWEVEQFAQVIADEATIISATLNELNRAE